MPTLGLEATEENQTMQMQACCMGVSYVGMTRWAGSTRLDYCGITLPPGPGVKGQSFAVSKRKQNAGIESVAYALHNHPESEP